jgi:hypothetical protein
VQIFTFAQLKDMENAHEKRGQIEYYAWIPHSTLRKVENEIQDVKQKSDKETAILEGESAPDKSQVFKEETRDEFIPLEDEIKPVGGKSNNVEKEEAKQEAAQPEASRKINDSLTKPGSDIEIAQVEGIKLEMDNSFSQSDDEFKDISMEHLEESFEDYSLFETQSENRTEVIENNDTPGERTKLGIEAHTIEGVNMKIRGDSTQLEEVVAPITSEVLKMDASGKWTQSKDEAITTKAEEEVVGTRDKATIDQFILNSSSKENQNARLNSVEIHPQDDRSEALQPLGNIAKRNKSNSMRTAQANSKRIENQKSYYKPTAASMARANAARMVRETVEDGKVVERGSKIKHQNRGRRIFV